MGFMDVRLASLARIAPFALKRVFLVDKLSRVGALRIFAVAVSVLMLVVYVYRVKEPQVVSH